MSNYPNFTRKKKTDVVLKKRMGRGGGGYVGVLN